MARYGQAYKDRIVARLLPPESSAVEVVSREVGVSTATLERWRAEALANGPGGGSQRWTAAARLQAVIATAAMDEATRSAWSREQGLYPAELDAWKQDAIAGHGAGGIVQRHSEPTGCLGLTTLAGHWHTIGDDHQTGHFRRPSKMVAIASASFGSQPRRWDALTDHGSGKLVRGRANPLVVSTDLRPRG